MLEKLRRRLGDNVERTLLGWSMVHRPMLIPGRPFDLTTHAYLTGLYECKAQKIVVYKASQMGASEWAISTALFAADQLRATVLYVFPTDSHVSDFSSARIGPAIEASPYLTSIVGKETGEPGSRTEYHGASRVTLKRVRDRFVYFRGARVDANGNAAQLKSIDADVVILDELDEMDRRVPALVHKRLGHSPLGLERYLSTPTYPGRGIHAEWMESDQREWFLRCPHCNKLQPILLSHLVLEWDHLDRPVRWNGTPDKPELICFKCKGILDRTGPGMWVAKYESRTTAGFKLTKLFSPTYELSSLIRGLRETDETKRKETYNQDLAEPYTPKGGQLSATTLELCKREYGYGVVPGERTWMGVDVGKVLHVIIRGEKNPEDGSYPLRWAAETSWDQLPVLVDRFNVKVAVIDGMPETTKSREFQAEVKKTTQVWLSYYTQQRIGRQTLEPSDYNHAEGKVNSDRTRVMDNLFAWFTDAKLTLPANVESESNYYPQIQAPIRVLDKLPNGDQFATYVEKGPDHFAHAEVYCSLAVAAPRGPTVRIRWA